MPDTGQYPDSMREIKAEHSEHECNRRVVASGLLSNADLVRCASLLAGKTGVVADIVRAVSSETGIPARKIYSRDRSQRVSEARWIVMFAAHGRGMSSVQIGWALNRDSSTVRHGIRMEEKRRAAL